MVRQAYVGLGEIDAVVREFEALEPYAAELLELRRCCAFGTPDYDAIAIAWDGLRTAAFHFTGRRDFYHELEAVQGPLRPGNGRLADRDEALSAFRALARYVDQFRRLQQRCRPFGRDYLALDIALKCLSTAAFHFTRDAQLYTPASDFGGRLR
jgi:hypothetical protein